MLNSLEIKNFRALEDFKVAKLGRVNLIVGKNNSGKSTVLEALRIYAGNANRSLLEKIAESHDEKFWLSDEEKDELEIPPIFEDFFNGRQFPKDDESTPIVIGDPISYGSLLFIQHVFFVEKEKLVADEKGVTTQQKNMYVVPKLDSNDEGMPYAQGLKIYKGDSSFTIMFGSIGYTGFTRSDYLTGTTAPCAFIPTQFVPMDDLANEWDKIAYTEYEKIVGKALEIIIPEYEHLVFVKNENPRSSSRASQRIAKVKLSNLHRPVPLNSLGDGMVRILQLALKLVSAKGGFLLIDEFENGLHYSTQEKVWALLFEMAERLDIQVFATTHSWDCVQNFTKVALTNETIEGVLFRMGKSAKNSNRGQIIATVFDKDSLYRMTQADIEIR
ncbi:MAG: AAA family ATPase [Methylobacter sp.]|nr:AAA family ATPase [Methylobacter sp.]